MDRLSVDRAIRFERLNLYLVSGLENQNSDQTYANQTQNQYFVAQHTLSLIYSHSDHTTPVIITIYTKHTQCNLTKSTSSISDLVTIEAPQAAIVDGFLPAEV